ncbi:protein MODIFIER OF SNC1 11-like isoform X2 [Juglans microcarpa x Juglans regia]|uniref:protein MODIFIER OF SNC1 11-like isoform X2 n=1 Tax=Juglans microcarpa x Juglans regia TaxID=2249226 RepID=UPI001B7EB903|nr:protein MODIFIER OF SNC1 11-like isoform X2 [Juglans microcarpa x Juglans regia]
MATESEKSNPNILSAQENPVKTLDSTVSEPDLHEHSPNNILTDCEDPNGTVSSPAGDDGPVSNIQKKTRRAERFGITLQLTEEEKRNSRAERFGLCDASVAPDDESRKKATADVEGKKKATADEEAKKKARLARFAPVSKTDTVEEEKRKARTIRFSSSPSSSLSQVNGKGDMEQKAAITGETGGGA